MRYRVDQGRGTHHRPMQGDARGTQVCDMILIFHVPLFSAWLKEVQKSGVRVQMVIDAPDDLEQFSHRRDLKDAVLYADGCTGRPSPSVTSAVGNRLTYECGEYPVMSQWGFADEPGPFDHWGGGHIHTFPNEGSANGKVVFAPGDIIILPYCRYVTSVALEIRDGHVISIEGGLDAELMRDWLEDGKTSENDRDPYALSHLGWGINPQARWYGSRFMARPRTQSRRRTSFCWKLPFLDRTEYAGRRQAIDSRPL